MARLAINQLYNQAPELLYWRLDSYIDFTEAQAPRAKEELTEFAQWHRRTQLPEYASFLQKMQAVLATPTDAGQICALLQQARGFGMAMSQQAEPATVWLAQSVSPAQLTHLERKFSKTNQEWRSDWLDKSPEALQKKRTEGVAERAGWLYGRLSDPQTSALRATLVAQPIDPALIYAERLRGQQDLLQTLRQIAQEQPGDAKALALLRGYQARLLNSPNPEAARAQVQIAAYNCTVYADLHNAATAEQRQQAVQRVKGYEADVRGLMRP